MKIFASTTCVAASGAAQSVAATNTNEATAEVLAPRRSGDANPPGRSDSQGASLANAPEQPRRLSYSEVAGGQARAHRSPQLEETYTITLRCPERSTGGIGMCHNGDRVTSIRMRGLAARTGVWIGMQIQTINGEMIGNDHERIKVALRQRPVEVVFLAQRQPTIHESEEEYDSLDEPPEDSQCRTCRDRKWALNRINPTDQEWRCQACRDATSRPNDGALHRQPVGTQATANIDAPWQIVPPAASLAKADGRQDEAARSPQSDDDLLCTGTSGPLVPQDAANPLLAHQDPANQMSKAQLELQWRAVCKLSLANGSYATASLVYFSGFPEHGAFILTNLHVFGRPEDLEGVVAWFHFDAPAADAQSVKVLMQYLAILD